MISLTACGGAVGGSEDPSAPPAPAERAASRQLRISSAPLHVPDARDITLGDHRPRGAVLGDVLNRIYFVTSQSAPAPTERVDLHVIGTEEVQVLDARLIDDVSSPFGIGAAEHFELSMPTDRTIAPGRTLGFLVRFKADTMEMQNAFVEIRTNAENTPYLRIALTGKVFHMP